MLSVIVPLFLVFSGCSGKSAENPCEGVVCERGVCEQSTGACSNAGSCLSDEQCVVGWVCNDSACEIQFPCADNESCGRGVCKGGACVNAEICTDDAACLPGYGCDVTGQCVDDPCAGVECDRGVCNPTSQTCVNSDVCTTASQARDCLDGYFCYGQGCELGQTICDDVDCARGVCDPATADCVSPESCTEDVHCLEGTYCSEAGSCAPNECDVQMQECARGVCNPADARCYNAETCDEASDCVDGYACANGSCLMQDELCPDGCPGTQGCLYDSTNLTAECVESGTCYSAVDCVGDRVCEDERCTSVGTPCVDDAFEPNDDAGSAVVMSDLPAQWAQGSICSGDVDFFTFDTRESERFRGVLVVDLVVAAVDVGSGNLTLEVEGPDGTTSMTSTDPDGGARINLDVGVLDGGVYTIRVGDAGDVGTTGIDYGLFVDLLDESTVDACVAAPPIGSDSLAGNTAGGDSYLLSSNCDLTPNDAGENFYTFTVDFPSWVRVVVDPDSTADLTIAIRHSCEAPSNIDCRNNGGAGSTEVLARFLPPGDYYLMIEGAGPGLGGPYMASLTQTPIVCTRDDSRCVDETTSSFCNGQGTGFEEQMCDNGCDAGTGRCARLQGDVCFTAINASAGISDATDWDTLTNDYDPGSTGCVPNTAGTQTAGPDKAYYVEVPPGYVLNAVQTLGSGDRGSLYLVEDCENLDSCVLGVNDNTGLIEELTYFNTTPDLQSFYLIADTELDSFGYNVGDLSIAIEETICTPGAVQCNGTDNAETCQVLGTAWDSEFCSFGCAGGVCTPVSNQDCSSPIDLANGPVTARIDEYSANLNPGFSGCTRRSASGPDAVYSVTPAAGEVALVSVTANFDASLYAVTDCSDTTNTCVAGSDTSSVTDETIQFAGDGVTTYYVVVDSQFSGSGIYTISASLQQPTCTPGVALQCLDSTTLQYCTELGIEAPYTCETTCSGASCDVPSGQICADAIVLTDGQSYSGIINTPNSINPGVGTSGACTFPSDAHPYGSDVIFAIDLLAGEWLFVDYDVNTSLGIAYLLGDCSDTDTCLARSAEAGVGQVVYESLIDQRVYFVLDRTTTTVSSLTYTVDVDIRRQDCVPGSPAFCSDVDTLSYCDNLGFSRDYTCNGTCTGGQCDTPVGDECIDAIRVTNGSEVTGDWSDGENNVQPMNVVEGSCEFDATTLPSGPEDIYAIDLLPGDLLQATLETNYGSAYHYILEDCFDTSTCQDNNFDRGDGIVSYYSEVGGTVYVVVDASSTFNSTSDYTLRFDVSAGGLCEPGATTCELGTLMMCDAMGTSFGAPMTCASGCATPETCAADLGTDLCATAPLTTGTAVYASFDDFTNDVAISSTGCTGSSGLGNDMIYAVNAGPGEVVHATLKSVGFESVQLYIATDCTDPDNTCQVGMRGDSSNFAEIFFTPTTFQTYYVVAESTSSFSDEPFIFDVEVVSPVCVPGDFQCAPAGGVMLQCNLAGLWENYPCSGGCMNNMCGNPIGQACFDAIPLADGGTDDGTFDVADNLNPGTGQIGTCNFGTQQANGADTVYSVDLLAGDVLNVTYTSSSSFGILYLMSDCNDTSSCIANTDDGTSGALQYAATADETIYIVMDRTSSGTTTLSYSVDVEILRPDCTPGEPSTCLDASTLQYCDALGFTRQYTCGGAAGTCTNGACDTPTADVCVDAGVVVNGTSISGDFLGTDDSSPGPGVYGPCTVVTGSEPDGVDHFYRVDLQAGEWIIADHTTATTAITYLVETCGDMSTCRAISAAQADGRLAYQATVAESLYLVVDRTTSGPTAISWDLDVIIGTPSCTPGTTQCSDATTLQWCNEYGFFEDWGCSSTCTSGACDDPSGEICFDAAPLVDGSSIMGDFDGLNSADLGEGTVGMCSFGLEDQPGTDRFYRLDLLAGQTATVDWTSTSSYAMLYFTGDCAEPTACISNTAAGSGGTIAYTATSAETVYLVVDRNLSGVSSLTYTLDVTIN